MDIQCKRVEFPSPRLGGSSSQPSPFRLHFPICSLIDRTILHLIRTIRTNTQGYERHHSSLRLSGTVDELICEAQPISNVGRITGGGFTVQARATESHMANFISIGFLFANPRVQRAKPRKEICFFLLIILFGEFPQAT